MKTLIAACLMMFAAIAGAEPQAGFEYKTTPQAIPTENAARIEVTELFWYGCPHCHQLEPQLAAWVKKLPADVDFRRVPAVPRPDWMPAAKAYYAMEILGVVEKLHAPFFEAIHKQKSVSPADETGIIDWITKQSGQDRKKVEEAFRSFSVNTKLKRSAQLFSASGATGVPALIIDGKYLTSGTMAGGNTEVLRVADYLVERARAEKPAKR